MNSATSIHQSQSATGAQSRAIRLIATLLAPAALLCACGGRTPAPAGPPASAAGGPAAAGASSTPSGAGSAVAVSTPSTADGPILGAAVPSTPAAPAGLTQRTDDIEADLAQVFTHLSSAGHDLQAGPAEAASDPRG